MRLLQKGSFLRQIFKTIFHADSLLFGALLRQARKDDTIKSINVKRFNC